MDIQMTKKQYGLLIAMNQVLNLDLDKTHPHWMGWDWRCASNFIQKNYAAFLKARRRKSKPKS